MKTRELTADEVNITLSEQDITRIPQDSTAVYPVDETAVRAINTALAVRGRSMNLFVCGPSAPGREAAVLKAARTMPPGRRRTLMLRDNPEKPLYPLLCEQASEAENCLLLCREAEDVPVILENNPVPGRLFGVSGEELPYIQAGSVIESTGGLLILNADDLLEEEESWTRLKRVLRSGRSTIGEIGKSTKDLVMPEIELDLKVAILGTEAHFDHFYNSDEDFRDLFQFLAEFDSVIEFNDRNLRDSVNYLRNFTVRETGCRLSDGAALEAMKFSAASAESSRRLTGLSSELEFVVSEAAAGCSSPDRILTAGDIRNAVDNQSARSSLLERRIIEEIKSGEINLSVDGYETGKVNGLAVIDKGAWSFGFPGLISARIAPGENGLVNIEHEAGLSGEIHDKWVLILEGYLRSRFAREFPLSIFASICFEQSYSEIDGDSASSSELYALLSAIADVPLRQDIAVTGSLSQTGEIQAVGGLREKIEGFYKACRALGFTGNQGVIVPERNIENIILPEKIIRDIRDGSFHIYPVSTVDDSMKILTDMEAGKRNSRGAFPHGSLNFLVEKNLKKLATQAKNFGG